MQSLDPHQRPPECIRNVYKKYQKLKAKDLEHDTSIINLPEHPPGLDNPAMRRVELLEPAQLNSAFQAFGTTQPDTPHIKAPLPVFEHNDMPGLLVIPALLPPDIQVLLLSRLLHRDLAVPTHLTNVHTHYNVSYPPAGASFFSIPPSSTSTIATPHDPTIHKPLSISQLLNRKMRWTTLGGQYDWTAKRYPDSAPPAFPSDIKALLEGIFPTTKAEAAIVNLYSPGDTLSVHRDVAEECGKGLISISLGCDAIFVIGTHDGGEEGPAKVLTLRLRSGSAVYMSGESRFAWHGVPQIVAGTCPEYLRDWPAGEEEEEFEEWRGWMAGKRVNLNVRQMWD